MLEGVTNKSPSQHLNATEVYFALMLHSRQVLLVGRQLSYIVAVRHLGSLDPVDPLTPRVFAVNQWEGKKSRRRHTQFLKALVQSGIYISHSGSVYNTVPCGHT